uniref:TIGR03960 family B12-binding radical SAM protein n=1 Tax=candidate division WOR-3 bacterium TaxID=2052148 RepID=A0A7V3UZJ2_UNCW3
MINELNEVLPLVTKPIRYTGGEYNSYYSESGGGRVRWVLAMPEVYEIGMSNYGLRILYSILNRLPGVSCERCYAPWPDFGNLLKAKNIPLYALESKRPVREFDIIGVSLQSELSYTNLLYLLDLAQLPRQRTARGAGDPLIVAGGPCTVNPLPLAEFIDIFVIGDGEEIIAEISAVYAGWDRKNRDRLLSQLARLNGVFVPGYTDPQHQTVNRRIINQLRDEDFPFPPIVPICEITHDRLTVEIARGCGRGCRFCQAGMINRPVRFRDVDQIVRLVERGIRASGWEEVSLLALSALDYPHLLPLIERLNRSLYGRRVSISLPSTRGEDFSPELAINLQEVKKAGLTFAPETASPRLRAFINKNISEIKILESVRNALDAGWGGIKLYFMVGLPGETAADVQEIGRFVTEIARLCRNRTVRFNLTPFIPKPHTPLQWAGFADINETRAKIELLKAMLHRRNVKPKWENPESSWVQAVLARGDEKINSVIEQVYQAGGIFQEWTEFFNFDRWQQAFQQCGVDPVQYLAERNPAAPLPWDFINVGVSREFLQEEYHRAKAGVETPDCLTAGCTNCGACPGPAPVVPAPPAKQPVKFEFGRGNTTAYEGLKTRIRLKYVVEEPFRFAAHLDRVRAFYRSLRRSELPIVYTRGFAPKPMLSFGPPLPVGLISEGEYVDLFLEFNYSGNIVRDLGPFLPRGLRIVAAQVVPRSAPALGELINLARYEVRLPATKKLLPGSAPLPPGVMGLNLRLDDALVLDLTIAPGIKLFSTLARLFGITETEARALEIKRQNCFNLAENSLRTPLGETTGLLPGGVQQREAK